MRTKKYAKMMAIVLAAASLSGAGMNAMAEESYEPVTVKFWNGWSGNDGEVLMDMVDEFNDENPYNITIEMDINSDFQNKIAASFAADEGPDMIIGVHTYKFTYPDYLIDMNEVFDKTSLEKGDWVQSMMDTCSLDDKTYILPFQCTGRYMYWNKDLFERPGWIRIRRRHLMRNGQKWLRRSQMQIKMYMDQAFPIQMYLPICR